MLEKKHDSVLILEDDAKFEPFFKTKMMKLIKEADEKVPDWDLM